MKKWTKLASRLKGKKIVAKISIAFGIIIFILASGWWLSNQNTNKFNLRSRSEYSLKREKAEDALRAERKEHRREYPRSLDIKGRDRPLTVLLKLLKKGETKMPRIGSRQMGLCATIDKRRIPSYQNQFLWKKLNIWKRRMIALGVVANLEESKDQLDNLLDKELSLTEVLVRRIKRKKLARKQILWQIKLLKERSKRIKYYLVHEADRS